MIKSKKQKRKQKQEWKKKKENKSITCFVYRFRSFKMKRRICIHLGGAAVDRYRADLGLSTFNDGRGIFDWNAAVVDGVGVGVAELFNVGGGDGATTTDGEIPRLMLPVRLPLLNFGLDTITGLLVVAAAVALANTFDTGVRRGVAVVAADIDDGDGDCVLSVDVFDDGNLAVTADDAFR